MSGEPNDNGKQSTDKNNDEESDKIILNINMSDELYEKRNQISKQFSDINSTIEQIKNTWNLTFEPIYEQKNENTNQVQEILKQVNETSIYLHSLTLNLNYLNERLNELNKDLEKYGI